MQICGCGYVDVWTYRFVRNLHVFGCVGVPVCGSVVYGYVCGCGVLLCM